MLEKAGAPVIRNALMPACPPHSRGVSPVPRKKPAARRPRGAGAPPSRWPGRRDRAGVPERPANRGAFGVGADHRGVSSSNYYDSERSDLGVCIERAPGRLGSARDFDHPRHSHSPTTQGLSLHCTGDLVFQHSGARDRLTIPDTAHSAHTTLPGVIPMVVGAVFQHSGGREILTIPDTPTTSGVIGSAIRR